MTTLMVSAVAIAQSVQPAPAARPEPTVHLVAAVQSLVQPQKAPLLTVLRNSSQALLGPATTPGKPPPSAAPLAIPIAPNLADTIDNIYLSVEPWVQYGFEVATSVGRWIPYVGWFAGQIMVLYNFGESIVASGVFNFTDWLRGDGGIAENVVDFGVDVGLAFVWLGLDEVAQFVPLPPFCCYPPRPPVQGPFLALETVVDPALTVETMKAASVEDPTPSGPEPAVVEGSDADEVEPLGEDVGEEQGLTDDVTAQESEADVTEDVDEADSEEAVDIDALAEEDTDGSAAQPQDGTDGDAVDGDAGLTAESTADAAPTTGADDTTAADSAEGDSAAE
jgi:hypothetical protein